jgi:hypothetical protein
MGFTPLLSGQCRLHPTDWCVMYVAAPHRLVANVGCTQLIGV